MSLMNIFLISIVVILFQHGVEGGVNGLNISREEELELERQLKILNKTPYKTIKVNGGDLYDCIDMYKQPALDHPLLKNHKIQMRPSSRPKWAFNESSLLTKYSRITPKIIGCPTGTVPVRRTRKEDLINAKLYYKTHTANYRPQLAGDPSRHSAAFKTANLPGSIHFGVKATFSTHNISVASDQGSFAQIWVEGGPGLSNSLQAGWIIQPKLTGAGDGLPRFFTSWTGDNKAGCYNLLCSGFVQVSSRVSYSTPFPDNSVYDDYGKQFVIEILIHQDRGTGNWWFTTVEKSVFTDIGYWPKNLLPNLAGGASSVGFGGFATASSNGVSPPMGYGKFPDGKFVHSAYFVQLKVVNEKNELINADQYQLGQVLEDERCYNVDYKGYTNDHLGVSFLYGGPGGNCGGT